MTDKLKPCKKCGKNILFLVRFSNKNMVAVSNDQPDEYLMMLCADCDFGELNDKTKNQTVTRIMCAKCGLNGKYFKEVCRTLLKLNRGDSVENTVAQLQQHFESLSYITPALIAEFMHYNEECVRHFCRQLFPCHKGYYRFYLKSNRRPTLLQVPELEQLISHIYQSSRLLKQRNQ